MLDRRQAIQLGTGLLALPALNLAANPASTQAVIQRPIPSSGELLPVIGMGTSITFDTDNSSKSLVRLQSVMRAFVSGGGTVIDSSPMYGNAETRVGEVLDSMEQPVDIFTATKVWTSGAEQGISQMRESARRMKVDKFDLIAVHNLKDWQTQLSTLKQWKNEGKVRYIGITTYRGLDHAQLLDIMQREAIDFVQCSYNIQDRKAEQELLPLAADRGIATMINRPYQRGALFGLSKGHALPDVAVDLGCDSWGQFYLKFVLGHPATTCIIPATSSATHMADNMKANLGAVPDSHQRTEMLRVFDAMQT